MVAVSYTHLDVYKRQTLTLVAYVIAIKRTSVCFGVLWGHLIFHEKGMKERLTGAVVMVLGVVLIVLS